MEVLYCLVLVSEFQLMFVYIFLGSVWVAEWPLFWKELPTHFSICSLCILNNLFIILVISRYGFRAGFGF